MIEVVQRVRITCDDCNKTVHHEIVSYEVTVPNGWSIKSVINAQGLTAIKHICSRCLSNEVE